LNFDDHPVGTGLPDGPSKKECIITEGGIYIMARQSRKKTPEAPKIDIGAEIFASLRELEKNKGIPVDYMVERLKQGMANAYRKDREDHIDIPAENVVVELTEKGLSVQVLQTAV
jgi:hypothetical protein